MNTKEEKEAAFLYLDKLLQFGIKLNLENISAILQQLGNPQEKLPCIHIAGTNGKGSISCMLSNALQNCQKKVGLFTSPYLVHFTERWRINGKAINEEKLASLILKISKLQLDITPTYFEVLTAVTFLWFAEEKVDIAILETGMGGRLDATNVCYPLLTIITNISLDHTQYLGNTIEKIALEKAGIIKQEIPLIIGDMLPEAKKKIIQYAKKLNAPIIDSTQYKITNQKDVYKDNQWCHQKVNIKNRQLVETLTIPLAGEHQVINTQTVYATIKQLIKINFINLESSAYQGIEKSYWAGRFDYISNNIIIDGAHNPKATSYLIKELQKNHPNQKWHILFACMNDKDWEESIDLLIPFSSSWTLINLEIPRVTCSKIIGDYLRKKKIIYNIKNKKYLQHKVNKNTLIVGSLYLAGEFLKQYIGHSPISIIKKPPKS